MNNEIILEHSLEFFLSHHCINIVLHVFTICVYDGILVPILYIYIYIYIYIYFMLYVYYMKHTLLRTELIVQILRIYVCIVYSSSSVFLNDDL